MPCVVRLHRALVSICSLAYVPYGVRSSSTHCLGTHSDECSRIYIGVTADAPGGTTSEEDRSKPLSWSTEQRDIESLRTSIDKFDRIDYDSHTKVCCFSARVLPSSLLFSFGGHDDVLPNAQNLCSRTCACAATFTAR